MTDKIKLAELTSAEAKEFLTDEAVILIPMGSLEDQGVHAPMGDYLGAECVAHDIARKARELGVPTFVTPPIPFGGRDAFQSAHGGMSLSHGTLCAVLDDMIWSLTRQGLTKILFVNGHGGNVAPLNEVALRWRDKGVILPAFYLWKAAYGILKDILGPEGAAASSGHGGDPLTSIGLHYYPEILRLDLMTDPAPADLTFMGMQVAGFAETSYEGVPIQMPIEAAEAAPHGIRGGHPKNSSADTGAKLSARLAEVGAGLIRDHVSKGFVA
ncbi:creatininase family protein [Mangrovicoccus ximenensis]|uniref:creatininase family protein n=1 Tax=Mangrovicoccus ximenensis TaxID=1911570 RepID=UPI000D334BF5|nr:creatininase family protein [Mangrovicoccus ximenensis]